MKKELFATLIRKQKKTSFGSSDEMAFFQKNAVMIERTNSFGFLLKADESFDIKMKFTSKPDMTFSGTNRFPPYLKVLDQLFESFFELEK